MSALTNGSAPSPAAPQLPFTLPPAGEVTFASAAIVKRRRLSYGKNGILELAGTRLLFVTGNPSTSWELALTDIEHLKKPWYGLGSYLTFDVAGSYYALAFGRRGPDLASITGASDLAIRYGGTAGTVAGLSGDAVAMAELAAGAALGNAWFAHLGKHP
jgi:hypothetical protein